MVNPMNRTFPNKLGLPPEVTIAEAKGRDKLLLILIIVILSFEMLIDHICRNCSRRKKSWSFGGAGPNLDPRRACSSISPGRCCLLHEKGNGDSCHVPLRLQRSMLGIVQGLLPHGSRVTLVEKQDFHLRPRLRVIDRQVTVNDALMHGVAVVRTG